MDRENGCELCDHYRGRVRRCVEWAVESWALAMCELGRPVPSGWRGAARARDDLAWAGYEFRAADAWADAAVSAAARVVP